MNKGEAWSAIERLRTVQLTLNGMFPEEFWKQHDDGSARKSFPSCYGIGEVAKGLKDYITANDDADSAKLVNDMVYGGEQKDNLCNILNAMAFYSDSPEDGLAREMRDAAKYLLDICYWLVSAVYKVPFREAYKYVVKGDKLVEVQEKERLVFPEELKTVTARRILYEAHGAGLLELTPTEARWKRSKSLLAYFAEKCSKILKLGKSSRLKGDKFVDTISYAPFEKLFKVKNLKQARYDAMNKVGLPDGFKDVNAIVEKYENAGNE